jgi:hypothetical protein
MTITITSTEQRPAQLEPPGEVPGLPADPGPPPSAVSAAEPRQTWVDEEEPEPSGVRPDWTTRFAWAKTLGGW